MAFVEQAANTALEHACHATQSFCHGCGKKSKALIDCYAACEVLLDVQSCGDISRGTLNVHEACPKHVKFENSDNDPQYSTTDGRRDLRRAQQHESKCI